MNAVQTYGSQDFTGLINQISQDLIFSGHLTLQDPGMFAQVRDANGLIEWEIGVYSQNTIANGFLSGVKFMYKANPLTRSAYGDLRNDGHARVFASKDEAVEFAKKYSTETEPICISRLIIVK